MKGIYLILNIHTGKYYVGQTVNLEKREKCHFCALKSNRHENDHLQKSFNKYGIDVFDFSILEQDENFSQEELNLLEEFYVKKFNSFYNGYNLTLGGSGTKGRAFSEQTRKMLAENAALKTGEKNPFFGKTHVDNWKEIRVKIYEEKTLNGWISSNRGIPKPQYAVEAMKKNMPHKKEILVDDILSQSISECALLTGIKRTTVRARLKNKNFPDYLYNTVEI